MEMRLSQRRMKRKSVRLPSGKVVKRTFRGKTSDHKCSICAAKLQVKTSKKRIAEVSKLSASKRRISRPYGAHLCTKCTRKLFSLKVMVEAKEISLDDVDIRFKKYL
jgi:ribosomal protein L34E